MLHPIKMSKVRMIGLNSDLTAALSLWRRLGVIELNTYSYDGDELQKGQSLELYDKISEHLVRVRGIKNALPPSTITPLYIPNAIEEAQNSKIGPQILKIRHDLKQLSAKRDPLEAKIRELERLAPIELDFSLKPQTLDYYVFSCPTKSIENVKSELSKITTASVWLRYDDQKNAQHSLLVIAIKTKVDISALCSKLKCTIIQIPDSVRVPKQSLLESQNLLESISHAQKNLNAQLLSLSEKYYSKIVALEEALSLDASLAREASKFSNSQQCFFATGWVKDADFAKFQKTTNKLLNGRIAIQKIDASDLHHEIAPTALQNPKVVRPFQFLVEFLNLPKSDEIDPSILLIFTVPLAYGMIMGDAGYALISFLLATLMISKVQKGGMMWHFSKIWQISAIPAFIFGILYDEYFAFTHKQLLGQSFYEPIVHRVHNVEGLLVLTVMVGWVYIALGFLLGAINEWSHSKKHAYAKLAWIIVQIGGTLAAGAFLLGAFSFELGIIGTVLLLLGVIVIGMFEGAVGLVEIPGLSANIMSFARIAAVGVGGVILAEAINSLLLPDPSMLSTPQGVAIFIITALAYCVAHVANIVIAMFEGFIHGARLSVVEFFQKFFHGGGKLFNPLVLRRNYTLDSAPVSKQDK